MSALEFIFIRHFMCVCVCVYIYIYIKGAEQIENQILTLCTVNLGIVKTVENSKYHFDLETNFKL